jgi:F0F1-type ATP synthase membrane subunit b/b'
MLAAGLLDTFGINGPSFAAQFVIIVLVIFTLNKFAFGPVTEMLVARRQRIEEA